MDIKSNLIKLNLDTNAQRNFSRWLDKLGQKPPSTIRFFDFSNCYLVCGDEDCELISKIIYKSTAFLQYFPSNDKATCTPFMTLSKHNFELAVRELLLVRNFRVEVYVRNSTEDGSDWIIEYRGSPGNLLQFEEILFNNKYELVGSTIISIQMHLKDGGTERHLGIAAVDQNMYQFQLLEFIDDDFFTELEASIILIGPRECLLPTFNGDYSSVKEVLERNNIMVTLAKNSNAKNKSDLMQDLNRLIRFHKGQHEDASALPEMKLNLAKEALRLVVQYLDLVNDAANLGQYEMGQLNLKRFVHLDIAAVSALNILPPNSSTKIFNRCQSVLGVLDHCRTPQGHRLMRQWVVQPLRNSIILQDRHNVVQCFLDSPDTLKILHCDILKQIPDVLFLTKRLTRSKASLQDLYRIYQMLQRTEKILDILKMLQNDAVKSIFCESLENYLNDLNGFKEMVKQVVDFKAIESGEFLISPMFDENLKDMKDDMSRIYDKMVLLQTESNNDLGLDRDQHVRLENVSHLGYHFRITLKDDSILRKNKKYKVLDVVKSGIRFSSDKLNELSNKFIELRKQYEVQQEMIVVEVVKVAVGYVAPLMSLNNELSKLDCLVSFAIAAQSAPIPYVRPKILEEGSGILNLKDVRHSCLEHQENINYIANDVDLKKDTCNMYIITGPNMGGKSTFIRSVGICSLMALIGSFVPCSKATISIFDSILGRVGASDNITKGLSTFMVEMIESSAIIRTATENSLVVIDELGRGTSTYEGCGIAWSIAEYLAKNVRCFTLFATHFHEITNLENTVETVKNYHMAAIVKNDNFTLLYKICPGVTERSFGIQIARLANFHDSVIQRAEEIYEKFGEANTNRKVVEFKKNNYLDSLLNSESSDDDIMKLIKDYIK